MITHMTRDGTLKWHVSSYRRLGAKGSYLTL